MTTSGRLARLCDVCGGYDDFPRHVISLAAPAAGSTPTAEFLMKLPKNVEEAALNEILDPTTYVRHMDCCVKAGCPDRSCQTALSAHGNASGYELLTAIQAVSESNTVTEA